MFHIKLHCTQLFWLYPQVCSPARSMNQPHKTHLVAHQILNVSVSGSFHCTFPVTVAWCWDPPFVIEARFLKNSQEINFRNNIATHERKRHSSNSRGLHFVWGLCWFHVNFQRETPRTGHPTHHILPLIWPFFHFVFFWNASEEC